MRQPHEPRRAVQTELHRLVPETVVGFVCVLPGLELVQNVRSRPNAAATVLCANAETSRSNLADQLRLARAKLGLDRMTTASQSDYAPNPKTVLPADLEFSPTLHNVSRLAMSA